MDELARSATLSEYPDAVRTEASRLSIAEMRDRLKAGQAEENLEDAAAEIAKGLMRASLRPAINLSGVILHTGLGRARLAQSAAAHVAKIAASHSAVELDLETGRRGDRQDHTRGLLTKLTGAEDSLVVNNAAAGVLLTLSALAQGREVILSRGQMVEIGGSFRMPDIVRQSGCKLVEVGCTNKTRLADYADAITPDTAAILRCHPSNFRIVGFTAEPPIEELAALCRESGIMLLDDQGNGSLMDLTKYGIADTSTLPGSISGGADIAIASGDKLLGGPQAGLIVGRAHLIDTIRKHPLARAVRIDKLTLACLEATLMLYAQGREKEIPTLAAISKPVEEIRRSAKALARAFGSVAVVESGETEVGGGSAPGCGLPTIRVGLAADDPEALARKLRLGDPPIVGRIEDGRVWLDPRTLAADELPVVVAALKKLST